MTERAIFEAALEIADAAERAAYLDQACGGDADLNRRLVELLAAQDKLGDFLNRPAAETAEYQPISERPGSIIGPYKVLEQIGEGGFGVVFMAEQFHPVRRKVALKILKPGMDTWQVVARFEAEQQALALMDHPNIARVIDGGATASGRPYFVMDLVRGIAITDYCDQNRLGVRERLELFASVCSAVQHAHQKGIIHRDLKPSNVLVSLHEGKPVAKVIDFGIAKAMGQQLTDKTMFTDFAQMIGTPLYMSPEQAEMSSQDIDTRSDIYSLGVLLYQLLTGTTPFDKKRFAQAAYDEIRRVIREDEPEKPSTRLSHSDSLPSVAAERKMEPARLPKLIRGDLDWITMKCLEKDRTRRYDTASGLAQDIGHYLAEEPVSAGPPRGSYRLAKFIKRNRGAVIAASVLVFAILAGIIGTSWGLWNSNIQRRQAEARARQLEVANGILDSVFVGVSPDAEMEVGKSLRLILGEGLDRAATELSGETIGNELIVAKLQNSLGSSQRRLGFHEKAIPLLLTSLTTRRAILGPDHADTLWTLDELGMAYAEAGRTDEACRLLDEALTRRRATLGPTHKDTLSSMTDAAFSYWRAGRNDDAIRLIAEAVETNTKVYGADNLQTLKSAGNLASAYFESGQLAEAIRIYEDTLKRLKINPGENDYSTLVCMNNLAWALGTAKRFDDALPMAQDCLSRSRQHIGPDHVATLTCQYNLGGIRYAAGRHDEAIKNIEEVVALMRAKLGHDHPQTLRSSENLALAYRDNKRLNDAALLYEQTLPHLKVRPGPDHDTTLIFKCNLAEIYRRLGRLEDSLSLFEEALPRMKANLGPNHPETLDGMSNGAVAYLESKQPAKALHLVDMILAARRKVMGSDSPEFAVILAQISVSLIRFEQFEPAEKHLRECLAIREKKQPDLWTTFNTRSMLGGALLGQKKYAEAEPLLLASFEGMKFREAKIPPQGKPRLTEAVERLIQLYDAWGRPDEATKWRNQLEELKTTTGS